MKKILFFILLILLSSAASAQEDKNWMYAGVASNNSQWFIRTNYESKKLGKIRIWIKIKFPQKTIEGKIYKNAYKMELIIVDCINKKVALMADATYDLETGDLLESNDYPDEKYAFVVPDSIMETVFNRICSAN